MSSGFGEVELLSPTTIMRIRTDRVLSHIGSKVCFATALCPVKKINVKIRKNRHCNVIIIGDAKKVNYLHYNGHL